MEHTFHASCRRTFRGVTCAETFEGAEGAAALAAHMKAAHGPRPAIGRRPAWINGNPFALKAPRPSGGGIEGVKAKIAAGEYMWPLRGGGATPAAEVED